MKAKIFVGLSSTGKSRVANMIREYVGTDKTLRFYSEHTKKNLSHIMFLFRDVSEITELLIFDDCPPDFDYSFFFPVVYDPLSKSEFKFEIIVEKMYKYPKTMLIPQLIFITEELRPEWREMESFKIRFDIVEFPLSDCDVHCNCSNKKNKI